MLMDLEIPSRFDLLNLITNEEDGINTKKNTVVVDQGDNLVWDILHSNKDNSKLSLPLRSYYVHAHLTDDHIYMKLNQVVAASEEGKLSTVLIKDKYIPIRNIYRQISEAMWLHIQSLDEKEKRAFFDHNNDTEVNNYELFDDLLEIFIKEKV